MFGSQCQEVVSQIFSAYCILKRGVVSVYHPSRSNTVIIFLMQPTMEENWLAEFEKVGIVVRVTSSQ